MTEQREPWHLDKRVPVALIVAIIVQTAAAIWFAANLDGRVAVLERDVDRERIVNDGQNSAIRLIETNAARRDEKLVTILGIVERMDRRLERMERTEPGQ